MNGHTKIIYMLTSPLSVNTFGIHQLKALYEKGFEVYLICGPGKLDPEVSKYTANIYISPNLRRGTTPVKDFLSLVHIFIIFIRLRPGILVYSTPKSALLGAVASFLARIPLRVYQVWGVRWQNLSGVQRILISRADYLTIRLSTKIITVSNSVFNFLNQQYKNNKMVVLGSGSTAGIDTSIFYPTRFSTATTSMIRIGYAGRVANDKGVSDLYNLFCKLSSQIANLNLEIIGDLDLEDDLPTTLVTALKSDSKVQWIPNVPQNELAKHMRQWDLQIFLSKREGLGNVILEAGACGVPTICWNIMGTRDAIPDFLQDHLIPYGDINLLEKSVISYFREPLNSDKKIAMASWYFEKFEQKKVLNNFVNFVVSSVEELNDYK